MRIHRVSLHQLGIMVSLFQGDRNLVGGTLSIGGATRMKPIIGHGGVSQRRVGTV